MMRLIRRAATDVATLLLALSLAVVIWIIAIRSNDPVDSASFQIPVQTINQPTDAVLLSAPEESVQLVLEGPTSALEQLSPQDFMAVVDLGDAPFGTSEVPIQVRFAAENVMLVSQFPETAVIQIEPIVSREIPVVPDIRGDVARGHARGQPLIEPDTITVTGPSSRVEPLAEARVTVFLDNSRETLVVSPRPIFRDRQGNIATITGLTLSADQIEVTIPIDELAGFAEKPITVDWIGEPAAGYRLLNVSVEPASVLVTGRPTLLESLSRLQTEAIDITGLTDSVTQQVALDLPEGISLEDTQPINVQVEIEPILTSSVVRRAPELRALAEGLQATVDPEEVRVFLFGPLPALDSLAEEDVRVTLDLLDLGVGTHRLEPIVSVSANDIEVRSFQPRVVTIMITTTPTVTNPLTQTLLSLELAPIGSVSNFLEVGPAIWSLRVGWHGPTSWSLVAPAGPCQYHGHDQPAAPACRSFITHETKSVSRARRAAQRRQIYPV